MNGLAGSIILGILALGLMASQNGHATTPTPRYTQANYPCKSTIETLLRFERNPMGGLIDTGAYLEGTLTPSITYWHDVNGRYPEKTYSVNQFAGLYLGERPALSDASFHFQSVRFDGRAVVTGRYTEARLLHDTDQRGVTATVDFTRTRDFICVVQPNGGYKISGITDHPIHVSMRE